MGLLQMEILVLDIVYVLGVVVLVALVALIARGVEKL
ncbi:hypothetical protein CLV54_3184 [Compostimonas suwonensis]|uniref:Uncharacterized protein n=1 Tax=Compostimonas suwonensis TaxID=1048394 RepID=A0A2M9BBI9_9MICO|nr:hypothetical protein CLV54_3184 [Compostimonas suwonensis]